MTTGIGFRLSLLSAIAAGAAAVQALAPSPAQAITQIYRIGATPFFQTAGDFNTNVGPAQDGWFDGFIRWDSEANDGNGAWTDWLITMYGKGTGNNTTTAPGPVLFKFASSVDIYNAGKDIADESTVGTYDENTVVGCFNSSLEQAAEASGNYYTGAPGSANCGPNAPTGPDSATNSGSFSLTDSPFGAAIAPPDASNNFQNNTYCPPELCTGGVVNEPPISPGVIPAGADLRWLNFYQVQNYNYTSGGDTAANYHFFRFPGYLAQPGNPGSFTLIPPRNVGQATNLGWSALLNDPAGDSGIVGVTGRGNDGIATTCEGDNNSDNPAGTCPFAGNQQRNQNPVLNIPPTFETVEIPAPLPLAGVVPLGVALKKMSKKRKQLLQS